MLMTTGHTIIRKVENAFHWFTFGNTFSGILTLLAAPTFANLDTLLDIIGQLRAMKHVEDELLANVPESEHLDVLWSVFVEDVKPVIQPLEMIPEELYEIIAPMNRVEREAYIHGIIQECNAKKEAAQMLLNTEARIQKLEKELKEIRNADQEAQSPEFFKEQDVKLARRALQDQAQSFFNKHDLEAFPKDVSTALFTARRVLNKL
jgi:hypothetical protein